MKRMYDSQLHKVEIATMCKQISAELLQKEIEYFCRLSQHTDAVHMQYEEFATNSRFLHRGYYCPSPVQDVFVANARRGKLQTSNKQNRRITHRYCFNEKSQLVYVESYLPDGLTKKEYLFYDQETVYGFAYDSWGTLVGLSREIYSNNRIASYFCASCYIDKINKINMGITNTHLEVFHYDAEGLLDTEFYFMGPLIDIDYSIDEIDIIIQANRYRFVRSAGLLTNYYTVSLCGEPISSDPILNKISRTIRC